MTRFTPGQIYHIRRWSDYSGMAYGTCEIVSVELKPEDEIEYRPTSIRGCFDAEIGTITFILHTATNNAKPKKTRLTGSKVSDEYAIEFKTPNEYQWFSPTARNYRPLAADRDLVEQ